MDPFDEDRPELTGSLISMEFGPGGRISQMWGTDPALPDEGEEFQFVLPPLQFGEESVEDYHPGTVLLGARTGPGAPWVLSRNSGAQYVTDPETELFDPTLVTIRYDFSFLDEIQGTGRFYEQPGHVPQIVWDLELRNTGKVSIEIGELGFPLAFNNFYDGFGWTDEQLERLWKGRVYIHQFIGGAASWVFAQRMTAEPPGLLVFPGQGTTWEFSNHVRASLNTAHQWEGIPVVYVYSRATMEREQWDGWMNGHSSLILEPGDSRNFQMRFAPTDSDKHEGVHQTLIACKKPSIRLLPSAVAPVDVGIALEVSGITPRNFRVSRDSEVAVDVDEEGGFCYVRPSEPGAVTVSFEDGDGLPCYAHLMFTSPIDELIAKRADYIVRRQVETNLESPLHGAVTLCNIVVGERVVSPDEYQESSGIECSLADALFLAEKNSHLPVRSQVQIVDRYIRDFLLDDVQNPGDFAVSSILGEASGIGSHFGRPLIYPHVFNLYHAMYTIASTYGETAERPHTYLTWAFRTAVAMFQHGWRHYVRTVGVLGFARVYDLVESLRKEAMNEEADELEEHVRFKAQELVQQKYPYAGESVMDTSGFEEVFSAALQLKKDEHLERTARCAFAARSLAPSWWWYGSDKRSWDGADSSPLRALLDRGEACLAHTTIPNSLIFFGLLDRDYLAIPEAYMRMAFGGMMGPWALVHTNGAASMCYCPDLSSRHGGFNAYTGASGLGYYHYLCGVGSYVLPNRGLGYYTFGCHFDSDGGVYDVRPWDGVGRRIVLRQIGAEFELSYGRILHLRMDHRKRWFEVSVVNPSDKDVRTDLRVRGMWGNCLIIQKQQCESVRGLATAQVVLPARQTIVITGKVLR